MAKPFNTKKLTSETSSQKSELLPQPSLVQFLPPSQNGWGPGPSKNSPKIGAGAEGRKSRRNGIRLQERLRLHFPEDVFFRFLLRVLLLSLEARQSLPAGS